MTEDNKMSIKLHVNGQFVGHIEKLEYERSAKELPSVDGYARFAPGNEITVSIQLTSPLRIQEGYILLGPNDRAQVGDERWSTTLERWLRVCHHDLELSLTSRYIVRRKALVIV